MNVSRAIFSCRRHNQSPVEPPDANSRRAARARLAARLKELHESGQTVIDLAMNFGMNVRTVKRILEQMEPPE